jgi:hypothetical protein
MDAVEQILAELDPEVLVVSLGDHKPQRALTRPVDVERHFLACRQKSEVDDIQNRLVVHVR